MSCPTQEDRPCEYAVTRSCSSGLKEAVVRMLNLVKNKLVMVVSSSSKGWFAPAYVAVSTFWKVRASGSVPRKPFGPYIGCKNTADKRGFATSSSVAETARQTPA